MESFMIGVKNLKGYKNNKKEIKEGKENKETVSLLTENKFEKGKG